MLYFCALACVCTSYAIILFTSGEEKRQERFGSRLWMSLLHTLARRCVHTHAASVTHTCRCFSPPPPWLFLASPSQSLSSFFSFTLAPSLCFLAALPKIPSLALEAAHIVLQSLANRRQGGGGRPGLETLERAVCLTLRSMLHQQLHKDKRVIFMLLQVLSLCRLEGHFLGLIG